MNLVAQKTTAQWREIWLGKLGKACTTKGLKRQSTVGFFKFLSRFLEPHSCHPANIPLEAISFFVRRNSKSEKQTNFCRDALTFFYTNVVEQGTGLRQIQEVLGHSSIKTTEIYTHVSNKEIAKIRSPLANLNLKNGTT
jgi:integrase